MFLRFLFLLLLALNLGVAGWLAFGSHEPVPRPAADAGVPELQLLSERGGDVLQQSAELSAAPQPQAPARDDRCFSLGPFSTEADVRVALDRLTPHVARIQYRQEQATASRGWWVFLPALPDRESAIRVARELSDKGVRDYYVVTAGDRQNTISLGLFHDPANAERRRDAIRALGFEPSMNERTEQLPLYYIDYAVPAGRDFAWAEHLPSRTDLSTRATGCF